MPFSPKQTIQGSMFLIQGMRSSAQTRKNGAKTCFLKSHDTTTLWEDHSRCCFEEQEKIRWI